MNEFLDLRVAYVLFEKTRKCASYVREELVCQAESAHPLPITTASRACDEGDRSCGALNIEEHEANGGALSHAVGTRRGAREGKHTEPRPLPPIFSVYTPPLYTYTPLAPSLPSHTVLLSHQLELIARLQPPVEQLRADGAEGPARPLEREMTLEEEVPVVLAVGGNRGRDHFAACCSRHNA